MSRIFVLCGLLTMGSVADHGRSGNLGKVVLLDFGDDSREQIAQTILKLKRCKPKVIAVSAFFEDARPGDSILRDAMERAALVVVPQRIVEPDSIVPSIFSDIAETGVASLILSSNVVDQFMFMPKIGETFYRSFPLSILAQYDAEVTHNLSEYILPGETYVLNIEYGADEFITLDRDPEKWRCEAIKDRIAMVGYLGPDEESMAPVMWKGQLIKMHLLYVEANIILKALDKKKFEPRK